MGHGSSKAAQLQDPEQAAPAARKSQANEVGMNTHWSKFLSGPYFRTIPATRGQVAKQAKAKHILQNKENKIDEEDYLGALKRIVLNKMDTDKHYGLTNDELVPLPFNTPRAWRYILDFALGAYHMASATVVMYVAILIDNDNRAAILGPSYNKWGILIKVVVTLYPVVTLVWMTALHSEQLMRRFMYYRLLSMRILVDWENKKIYKTWFFYYFLATWALLNVWSIYGVVRFWPLGVRSGADTVAFGAFVVVNLQTIQLLIQYNKILTSEKRLVSLNLIFERAPVEAQMLLSYTYVIEEQVLVDECRAYGFHATKAFRKRALNLLTCGATNKSWHKNVTLTCFNLDNLRRAADNYNEVEAMVAKLRQEVEAEAGLQSPQSQPLEPHMQHATVQDQYDKEGKKKDTKEKKGKKDKPEVEMQMSPVVLTASAEVQPSKDVALAIEGVQAQHMAGRHQRAEALAQGTTAAEKVEQGLQHIAYYNFYGTIHAVLTSVMGRFPSWPYRDDVAYMQLMLIIELIGLLSVAAIVVFGLLRATRSSQCASATKTCESCFRAIQQLVGEACNTGFNITEVPQAAARRLEL